MKFHLSFIILFCLLSQGCKSQPSSGKVEAKDIRPPAVAGKFYPADPEKLSAAIDAFMGDARHEFPLSSPPVALIAPHAGYIYSGQIAADAYRQAMDFDYDLVIILGTNHTGGLGNDISIYPEGAYRTPLGLAEIDKKVSKKLTDSGNFCIYNPSVHRSEHSVEVHVPFVQKLFPEAKIVAVVIGTTDLSRLMVFGDHLAEVIKDSKALIVASSDFSHYPDYEDAKDVDGKVRRAIRSGEPQKVKSAIIEQMSRGIRNLSTCACGEGPILAAMYAAKALGSKDGYVISYANSGDAVIGDPNRVVGYGAVVFVKKNEYFDRNLLLSRAIEEPPEVLSIDEKRMLLNLARETIDRYLTTETVPLPRGYTFSDNNNRGAFVTLNKHGNLRGCIGHMAEDMPLSRVVGSMALQAAFNDRRFPPVTLDELDEIDIEISMLTPLKQVKSADDIIIGRDGIKIMKNGQQAVYLPQVATEQGWDLEETLGHLCQKAGLPKNGWKNGMEFYTFQAEVFAEGELE